MTENRDPRRLPLGNAPSSLFGRILATIGAAAVFALAFMFSLFVLAGVLALGVVAWGWFWWKTRGLRRDIQARMREVPRTHGRDITIIEGEVIRSPQQDEPPRP